MSNSKKIPKKFKDLYNRNADVYDFFDYYLTLPIKDKMGFESFEKGWQYRTVLNVNGVCEGYREFQNLIKGVR